MKLYIITNYKKRYPELNGSKLTDALIKTCIDKPDLEISRTVKGKPYCEGMHFSVSHSMDVFACVFSDENIGLDIQHKRNVKAEKIAGRYFTDEELKLIEEEQHEHKEFFRLWTRKEAYCKYTGEGLSQILRKVDVINREDVYFIDLMIEDEQNEEDCFCAICVKNGDRQEAKGDIIDEIQITY